MTSIAASPSPMRAPLLDRVAKLLAERPRSRELRGGLAATSTPVGSSRAGRRLEGRANSFDVVRGARRRVERG